MARQRIEDLGRILEIVTQAADHDVFSLIDRGRKKDYFENFIMGKTEQEQWDQVDKLVYGIGYIEEYLYKIMEIAKGLDALNQDDDIQ